LETVGSLLNTHVPLLVQQHMVDRHSLNLKPWSAKTLYVYVHADLAQKFLSPGCSPRKRILFPALSVERSSFFIQILQLPAGKCRKWFFRASILHIFPGKHAPGPLIFTAPLCFSVTVMSCSACRVCTWLEILNMVPNLAGTD
jgi:hypothetical protein